MGGLFDMSVAFLEFPPHTRDMGGSMWSRDQAPGGEKIWKIFTNFFNFFWWISLLEHVKCMKNCFLCVFSPFVQQKLKFFSPMSFFCFSIFQFVSTGVFFIPARTIFFNFRKNVCWILFLMRILNIRKHRKYIYLIIIYVCFILF
jgi:fucose 4-O-acetylase-like acetyltransferase